MNTTRPVADHPRGPIAWALARPITARSLLVVLIACAVVVVAAGEILLLLGLDAYGAMSVVLAACIALIYAMRVRAWRTRGRS